ncbi:MAG: GNAT family N-acetyltransferase, partial [Bacteroidales bacterium]|nr:GNAT family N-acetyltransferase [Bacteroidales bacterium]
KKTEKKIIKPKKGEKTVQVKTMTLQDLNFALEWADSEGWNPGEFDAEAFYYTDPQGFFIGELSGMPIGCISAVRYNDDYGFIGFHIIAEEYRKKWYGAYLARVAYNHLGNRNFGINGVMEKLDTYVKLGFIYSHRNTRFLVRGKGVMHKELLEIDESNFNKIVEYDKSVFLHNRALFLDYWINKSESGSLCFMEKDKVRGYGVIRKCREGFKIAPLFADSFDIAQKLLCSLLTYTRNEDIYIDIPHNNKFAAAFIRANKMKKVFDSVRMYSKEIPKIPTSKVFGLTSYELG